MAASVMCESQLSLKELMELGQSVEDRLADPKHPHARSTLRVDLMWVAGVELKIGELELPHPELLTKSWAIGTFIRAAEEAVPTRAESRRLLAALEKVPGPHEIGGVPLLPPELRVSRSSARQRGEVWKVEGRDWPDGLAAAAYAVGVVQLAREQTDPAAREDPVDSARNAAKDVRSEALVRIDTPVATDGSDSEIARQWLAAVDDALRTSTMRIATAVVFETARGRVRGAVIGERLSQALEGVRLWSVAADRDPADSRDWAEFHGFSNIGRVALEVDSVAPPDGPIPGR